jgi:hypothetical protein
MCLNQKLFQYKMSSLHPLYSMYKALREFALNHRVKKEFPVNCHSNGNYMTNNTTKHNHKSMFLL